MVQVTVPYSDADWISLEMDIRSLFTPSGPIDEAEFFAGRQIEIRQLFEAAVERSKHAVIFGERGIGKTSLANVFWRRFSKRLQSIIAARVQADPSDDFTSLWGKALRQLRMTAISHDKGDLIPIRETYDLLSPDDVRLELEKCRPNALPIIIIDEFDKLEEANAVVLTANVIKSLSDYGINCTIIIVGVAESLSDLIAEHESIKRCLVQVPLERMEDSELREIVTSRLKQTPMRIVEAALKKIIQLSKGLPFYVHILAKFGAISATDNRRLTIEEKDIVSAMDNFLAETAQTLNDDYRKAIYCSQPVSLFKPVLLACALAEPEEGGFFKPSSLIAPLSRILKREVTIANFQKNLTEFLQKDRGPVLIKRPDGRRFRYRFRDPMMQPHVIIKGIREGLIDEASIA